MSRPFDVTLKFLLESYPADWLRILGFPAGGPVDVLDADLSTVTAEADKVFRLAIPSPALLHIEPQASYAANLPDRTLLYNVLLSRRHALPTTSIVLLLRSRADGPAMTGRLQRTDSSGATYLDFRYHIVRVWQLSADLLLSGGLGTLPLALLADDSTSRLSDVVHAIDQRLAAEADSGKAASLLTATYILMGLRYSKEVAARLLQGVRSMRESETYQAILDEGKAEGKIEGAREALLIIAGRHLGPPGPGALQQLESIRDYARLKRMTERSMDASDWADLLNVS